MPDRERVINTIDGCINDKSFCNKCDYDGCVFQHGSCEKDLLAAALSLLKEQEAVPVTQREVMHMLFWCCGSCGVAITDGDKFCRMCGKPVKWNDEPRSN